SQVFVAGQNPAALYALNTSSGAIAWQTATTAVHFLSAPLVAHGSVFEQADDGNLYAFSAVDGSRQWTVQTGGASGTPSYWSNGTYSQLYVPAITAGGGNILVINA